MAKKFKAPDVLAIVADLTDRLWTRYGDALAEPKTQDEVHMTYYAGEVLRRNGHQWFKAPGVEGACYTERAMQDAFTAGRRIGRKEGLEAADDIVAERIAAAHAALAGEA